MVFTADVKTAWHLKNCACEKCKLCAKNWQQTIKCWAHWRSHAHSSNWVKGHCVVGVWIFVCVSLWPIRMKQQQQTNESKKKTNASSQLTVNVSMKWIFVQKKKTCPNVNYTNPCVISIPKIQKMVRDLNNNNLMYVDIFFSHYLIQSICHKKKKRKQTINKTALRKQSLADKSDIKGNFDFGS